MKYTFFNELLYRKFDPDAVLDLKALPDGNAKVIVISDFHMGTGKHDDFRANGEMVGRILEEYYFKNGWHLVLNGDIEELAKFPFTDIRREWDAMYRVFDLFASAGRLYKILGNHDAELIFEKDYPYPLYEAVRIETGFTTIYIYHGHQASLLYTIFNSVIRLGLKYLLKPIGIKNISSARSPKRSFHVEQVAYNFSRANNCISIIGHTHRSLFESLSRFDYIKFEIERFCRDYPSSSGVDKERIVGEVKALRGELAKLKRKECRGAFNPYGHELPLPCLFNSGCAIGKKGINAIELDAKNISLVYWFAEGNGMKFINRGWYNVEKLAGSCRAVLNKASLDYVKAKIELFSDNP